MNGIFFTVFTLSVVTLIFKNPESALSAMLNGGERALELTLTMVSIYAVWLGILKIAENCGLTTSLARALKKPIKLLFGKVTPKAEEYIAMNLSANLLGMGGVATPMGIQAATELDRENNVFATNMLFVLAATSIQLLPTSVIALRAQAGSSSPGDIIIPTLIGTAISSAVGIALSFVIFWGKRK